MFSNFLFSFLFAHQHSMCCPLGMAAFEFSIFENYCSSRYHTYDQIPANLIFTTPSSQHLDIHWEHIGKILQSCAGLLFIHNQNPSFLTQEPNNQAFCFKKSSITQVLSVQVSLFINMLLKGTNTPRWQPLSDIFTVLVNDTIISFTQLWIIDHPPYRLVRLIVLHKTVISSKNISLHMIESINCMCTNENI